MPRPHASLSLVAAAVVVAVAASFGGCNRVGTTATPAPPGAGVVVRVVDGDTVHIRLSGQRDDESVRLIGIDTPETHGPGGLRECFGQEATTRLRQLLPVDTPVRVVRDAEARDRFGRLLAYVYRARDNRFINLTMAKEGFAVTLTIPPNVAHSQEFVAAVAQARDDSRGLWKRCGGADTPLGSGP